MAETMKCEIVLLDGEKRTTTMCRMRELMKEWGMSVAICGMGVMDLVVVWAIGVGRSVV